MRDYVLPRQKIGTKEKNKKWVEAVVDDVIARVEGRTAEMRRATVERKRINYDLYNGRFNPADFEYVTDPYGSKSSGNFELPANLAHYDITSSRIDVLIGEELKRPFNYRVKAVNSSVISSKEQALQDDLLKSAQADLQAKLAERGITEPPQEAGKSGKEIMDYHTYSYKDMRETVAQDILDYLQDSLKLQKLFNDGFKDALITAEEIYYVGVVAGNPYVRLVNPLFFYYDKDSGVDFIEDGQWALEIRYMSPAKILDEYGDELNDDEIAWLDEGARSSFLNRQGKGDGSLVNIGDIQVYRPLESPKPVMNTIGPWDQDGIEVIDVEWKSMRKIGFVSSINEKGDVVTEMVDEYYKPTKDESIEWRWINEVWQCTKIGNQIYTRWGPKLNQQRTEDNPSECKLSYTGYIHSSRNSEAVSLVDRIKPYQYLYNVIWYRLELEIAKAKGKKIIIDTAQIPKTGPYAMTMDEWLYYQDALGIVFINSHEESEKGKTSGFNQFKELDSSVSASVKEYINILQSIKATAAEVSGVMDQRLGQISSSELVGNVERAVLQSSTITELWFYYHNQVKKQVMTNLIECAKMAWRGGKKLQHILSDLGTKIINVDPSFNEADYGIFITDSSKEFQVLESLKQLSQNALQGGLLTMSEVGELMRSNSIVETINKLKMGEEKRSQQMQQMEQQKTQLEQQKMQFEMETRSKELQIDSENNIRDNTTMLQIKAMELGLKQQELEDKKDIEEAKLRTTESEGSKQRQADKDKESAKNKKK